MRIPIERERERGTGGFCSTHGEIRELWSENIKGSTNLETQAAMGGHEV